MRTIRQLGKIFLQGLAAVLPLTLTLYVLWWLGATAERAFAPLIRKLLPEDAYLPGLGVALGIGVVLAVGMMLRAWWIRSLLSELERLLEQIPLVKTLYGSVKDLMTFFSGTDRKELDQVVTIRIGDSPIELLGLITNDRADEITGREGDADRVAIYLPMSYQIGGFMALVPRDSVERVDMGVEDALRTIVTAGLSGKTATSDDGSPTAGSAAP